MSQLVLVLLLGQPVSIWLAPADGKLEDPTEAVRDALEDWDDRFPLVENREAARVQLRITDFRISRSTRLVKFGYLDIAGPGLTQQERVYESWRVTGAASMDGEIQLIIGMDGPKDASRMNMEAVVAEFVRDLEVWLRDR